MADKFVDVKVDLDHKAHDLYGDNVIGFAVMGALISGLIGFSLIFPTTLALVFTGAITCAVFKFLKNHFEKVREQAHANNRAAMEKAVSHTGLNLAHYGGSYDNAIKTYLIDPKTDEYYTSVAGHVEGRTFNMVFANRS